MVRTMDAWSIQLNRGPSKYSGNVLYRSLCLHTTVHRYVLFSYPFSYPISLKCQVIRAATMNTHEYKIVLLRFVLLRFGTLFSAFPLVQLFQVLRLYSVQRLLRVTNELGLELKIAEQRLGEVRLQPRAQLARVAHDVGREQQHDLVAREPLLREHLDGFLKRLPAVSALSAEALGPEVIEVAAVNDGVGADAPVAVGQVPRDVEAPVIAALDALKYRPS